MDNLAKEAMIARKAGLTYGRWKAKQKDLQDRMMEEARRREAERQQLEEAQQLADRRKLAAAVTLDPGVRLCGICGKPLPKGGRYRKYHPGDCADIAAEIARERGAENKNRRARELYEARKKANSKAV